MKATERHTPQFEAESEAEFWERTEEMALRHARGGLREFRPVILTDEGMRLGEPGSIVELVERFPSGTYLRSAAPVWTPSKPKSGSAVR